MTLRENVPLWCSANEKEIMCIIIRCVHVCMGPMNSYNNYKSLH